MAKVIYGPIVTDARKRCGSVIFNRNRGGAFIQNWTRPALSRTPAQAAQRDISKALTLHWQLDLTDAQRVAWQESANLNPTNTPINGTRPLTAYQWFMRVNSRAMFSLNPTWFTDPPVWTWPPQIQTLQISGLDHTTQTISVDATPQPDASWYIDIFVTPPLSPGVMWPWRKMQLLGRITSTTPTPVDFSTAYAAIIASSGPTGFPHWAAFFSGCRIGVLARPVDTATGQPGSTTSTMTLEPTGASPMPTYEGASITIAGDTAIPLGTDQLATWDTVLWDVGPMTNLTTYPSRLTAVAGGKYLINFNAQIGAAYPTDFSICIQKNGSQKLVTRPYSDQFSTGEYSLSATTIDQLAPGDYIEVLGSTTGADPLLLLSTSLGPATFSAQLISS